MSELPPVLDRLIAAKPALAARVRAMYAGCQRKGRGSTQAHEQWVLRVLRKEAEDVLQRPAPSGRYRDRARYAVAQADDMSRTEALTLLGAINRAVLESAQ